MAKPNMKQPETTNAAARADFGRFDFIRLAWPMGGISLLATIISLIFIFTKGFNYGIDFAGGTEVQIKFDRAVAATEIRSLTDQLGVKNASVQSYGDQNEFLIRMESPEGANEKETNALLKTNIEKLKNGLKQKFDLKDDGIRRVDTVGPAVGSELKRNGLLAAFYCFLVILIYVALRFDYKYAPGAVICLIHDSVFTLGVFSMLGKEVNVQIMAAVLTLIGYSLNDTIVNYDRIRETYPTYRDYGMKFVINRAINDMLGRTILTSGMTFLGVLALFTLGTGVIKDIAFTMLVGIIIGTYSSVYVAAPLILVMDKLKKKPA